jgi:hypothetical protein
VTPIFEILYPVSLGAFFFACYAGARGGPERRLAFAWLALFALAGIFRVALEIAPGPAPALCGGLLFLALGWVGWGLPRARVSLRRGDAYWIALLVFLGARSFFPQFDVDSLLYHLAGVKYLAVRGSLPAYQQHSEVASLWYDWLGPEESLLAPVARLDLGIAGGLLGGVFKAVSVFTVVALVPRRAFLLRAVAAFLLLVDDHFFFSGQCRFVYLNPTLVGLLALGCWCTWRAWRCPRVFALPAILVLVMATAVKLHGIFFLAGALAILTIALVRRRANPLLKANVPMLGCAAVGVAGFFLLKWITLGSPLAPFDFLFWRADHAWRGTEYLLGAQAKKSAAAVLHAPWRALIFPGNLAMKAVVVLLVPAALLAAFRSRRNRWFLDALALFAATAAWALLSHYLNPEESRYPRYVFGAAVLGLAHFGLGLRHVAGARYFAVPVSHAIALFLVARLVLTVDTRYFNVPTGERPHWENIAGFARSLGRFPSVSPRNSYLKGLLVDFQYTDVAVLEPCWESLPEPLRSGGAGLVAFPFDSPWPALLIAPGAVFGTPVEGGGSLRRIDGVGDLAKAGIRFALVPKDPAAPPKAGPNALRFEGETICESAHMRLLRLEGVLVSWAPRP